MAATRTAPAAPAQTAQSPVSHQQGHINFNEGSQGLRRSARQTRASRLQPIATGQVVSKHRTRSHSPRYPLSAFPNSADISPHDVRSPQSALSNSSLATPGLNNVRKYYKEHGLHTALQSPLMPNNPPPTPSFAVTSPGGHSPRVQKHYAEPRRHSLIVSPATALSRNFDRLRASSPISPSNTRHRGSIVDESRALLLRGVSPTDMARLGSIPSRERRASSSPVAVRWLPHDGVRLSKPRIEALRQDGPLYLGHAESADVFVRATALARPGNETPDATPRAHQPLTPTPSTSTTPDATPPSPRRDNDSVERLSPAASPTSAATSPLPTPAPETGARTIRARVSPANADRKPFLLSKRFSLAELEGVRAQAIRTAESRRASTVPGGTPGTPRPESATWRLTGEGSGVVSGRATPEGWGDTGAEGREGATPTWGVAGAVPAKDVAAMLHREMGGEGGGSAKTAGEDGEMDGDAMHGVELTGRAAAARTAASGRDARKDSGFLPVNPQHSPSPSPSSRRASVAGPGRKESLLGGKRTVMPIHLHYAASYLPALAALLISGLVHRHDAIDLPVPHPAAWADTVRFVYTGVGPVSGAVRENVEFLGGRVEWE